MAKPLNRQLSTVLKRLMESEYLCSDPFYGNRVKLKYKELLGLTLMAKAAKGNIQAMSLIFDRVEGKATQPIDLEAVSELKISWGQAPTMVADQDAELLENNYENDEEEGDEEDDDCDEKEIIGIEVDDGDSD